MMQMEAGKHGSPFVLVPSAERREKVNLTVKSSAGVAEGAARPARLLKGVRLLEVLTSPSCLMAGHRCMSQSIDRCIMRGLLSLQ